MIDFEISEQPKLKIKIFGEIHEVKVPAVQEILAMEKSMQEAGPEKAYETILTYLIGIGIPEEKVSKLTIGQMQQLIEVVATSKKK